MLLINFGLGQLESSTVRTETDVFVDSIEGFRSAQEESQCLFKDIPVDLLSNLNQFLPIEFRCHLRVEFIELRQLGSGAESSISTEELAMNCCWWCLRTQIEPTSDEHIPWQRQFFLGQCTSTGKHLFRGDNKKVHTDVQRRFDIVSNKVCNTRRCGWYCKA